MAKYVTSGSKVEVQGLKELRADLRRVHRLAPRIVSAAHKRIAQRVAEKAKATAQSQGSTAAHVAPSIRAGGQQRAAIVSLGGSAYPMALGAEFGARQYPQFKPWTGNSADAGYFLFPTIREAQPDIESDTLDALMDEFVARSVPLPL